MRNASLYRVGGTALLAGAVLDAVAVFLHSAQPLDLASFAALAQGQWLFSHWLFVIGNTLLTGGLFAVARHLFATKNEGLSVVGFAAVVTASALFIAVVAPEIVAFPALAQSADPGAPQAFLAVNLYLMSLMHVAIPVFWGGIACLAVAMLGDQAFPRTFAQAGVAIALLEIIVPFTPLGENWMLFKIVFGVGFAWLAIAGNMLRSVKAAVPAY